MDKTTKVFNGKAMGVEEKPDVAEEDSLEDTRFHGLEPINFEDKVMGGEKSKAFLSGKTNDIDGPKGYEKRLETIFKSNSSDGVTSYKDKDMSSFFSTPKFKFDNPFSNGGFNMKDKKQNVGFDPKKFFQASSDTKSSNPFSKVDGFFNLGSMKQNKSPSLDVNNFFGTRQFDSKNTVMKPLQFSIGGNFNKTNLGFNNNPSKVMSRITGSNNPERVSRTRIKQSKGLSLYGDFDGDKLANVLDCDPLNPNEQGNQHDLNAYMPSENPSTIQENFERNTGVTREELFGKTPRNDTSSFNNSRIPSNNIGMIDRKLETTEERLKQLYEDLSRTDNKSLRTSQSRSIEQLEKSRRSLLEERSKELNRLDKLQGERPDQELKKERFEFDKQKYYDDKDMTRAQEERKKDLEMLRLGVGLEQFGEDKKLQREKLDFQREQSQSQLERQQELDKQKFRLERRKLNIQEGKNERVLFENKLKYGNNLLSGVIGSFGTQSDFSQKTGALSSGMTPTELVKQPDNVSMFNQASKFDQSLGPVGTKGFGQVVGESLGGSSAQPQPQPQPQVQPQPQPQPQPQVQPQPQPRAPAMSQDMKDRFTRMGIDWSRITPEEAARVDPEYAKYLKESKGETTYRRGPYKK